MIRDRERRRAYQRQYQKERRARDPVYLEKQRAAVRECTRRRYHKDPEYRARKNKARNIRRYGLTIEQYDSMLIEQGGGCAICKVQTGNRTGSRLHIDHCHDSGRVRGLLCSSCNMLLGCAGDSIEHLLDCISYLRERANGK